MSGGVDSAAAAYLLHKQGHDVFGVTLSLWKYDGPAGQPHSCCRPEDIRDARRVAQQIGIRHYTLDYEAPFKEAVIDRFADDYAMGRTPSPCILCNTHIKFGRLYTEALALGADAVATGHYARIVETPDGPRVARATDRTKDQSYFLFELSQSHLARILFPLGDLTKTSVREMLRDGCITIHEKPESQEICFVGTAQYPSFLRKHYGLDARPGKIVGNDGDVLGEHQGIHMFTVGQRRGLGLSGPRPYYVTGIDPATSTVRVGLKADTFAARFELERVTWGGEEPHDGEYGVQIRSRHKPAKARVNHTDAQSAAVEFVDPQSAITPGQAAVFYRGDVVEGGGWIARVF